MKNKKLLHLRSIWALMLVLVMLTACKPELEEMELGALPRPTFTIEAVADKPNTYLLTNTTSDAFMFKWDKGDGTGLGSLVQTATDTVVYENKGTYTVTLLAFGSGGHASSQQTIVVENDMPKPGGINLLLGSDLADDEYWNFTGMGASLTTTEFNEEGLNFSNGAGPAQTNIAVWQAVEVEAGKQYRFGAQVSGSGAENSWFEVFFGSTQPVEGSDYTTGGYTALNTWAGCATSEFSGNLAVLGCNDGPGTGRGGLVTFDESGTIYLVMKVGSWDGTLGTSGITLSSIELIEIEGEGPVEGADLIVGGSMQDDEFWTVTNMGATLTTTEFSEIGLKFSNGSEATAQTNVAVWQALEVEAGKQYRFSANVGGSGAQNSWFELIFGSSAPVEGADYTEAQYTGLNTWAGCATSSFSGNLAALGCSDAPGTGRRGIVEFEESGIIYLVMKVGSWDGTLGESGITIKDVKLVELE